LNKGGIYWEIWREVFQFHKTHADVQQTDEWWEKTCQDINKMVQKYKGNPCESFVADLSISVLKELERKGKENGIGN